MKRKDLAIIVLVLVILFLVWKRKENYMSYFSNEDVTKARDMMAKGFKDLDIAAELARKGVDPNDIPKVISQAKGGAPAAITAPK
jgi:hypothetical protein